MKTLEKAFSYLGTEEVKGRIHNKDIIKMFADVGHQWVKNDETAWCAAFVGSCLDFGSPTAKPKLGDLVVFWRGNKNGWQGHVGFYLNEHKGYIYTLGGNQSDSVCVKKYPKTKVLGYRTYQEKSDQVPKGYVSRKEFNETITMIINYLSK